MNRLSRAERAQIIRALVEGNSIRSTARMTGAARNTISTLLVQLGNACAAYQDRALRNLTPRRIECDEIWSFCYAKAKNVPEQYRGDWGYGDVWTWTAIDPDTKLVASWLVGWRGEEEAVDFLMDLRSRLANRIQLTTDGHVAYVGAVERAFGNERGLRPVDQGLRGLRRVRTRPPRRGATRQTRSPGRKCAWLRATRTRT